jgi:RNA polymerase sigma factor (sigma-70 family)
MEPFLMTNAAASPVLQWIRTLVADQHANHLADHELLTRFSGKRDEAAFHVLVRRHGPMVFDVCRNILGNEADAEDAFQATFLVLASKTRCIRRPSSLASWLHGVAYRTASNACRSLARRREHEAQAPGQRSSESPADLSWLVVREVLHEELNQISECYRAPLVLCYLEGKTQDEAAAVLGVSRITVNKRLEHGRALLRVRLTRRGLGAAGVLLAGAWPTTAWAQLPPILVSSTIKAATLVATGQAAAAGAISAKVAALTQGVLKAMFLTKLKTNTAALLVAGSLVGGLLAGLAAMAAAQPGPPVQTAGPQGVKLQEPDRRKQKRATDEEHELTDSKGRILFAQSRSGPSRVASIRMGEKSETLLFKPRALLEGFEDDFRISPDGKMVAYRVQKTDGDTKYAIHIRALDPDSHPVDMEVDGQEVCWSGDGNQIAVSRGKSGNVIVDVKTKKQTAIELPEGHWITDWSRDGSWFLVQFTTDKGKWQLARMKQGGTEIEKLAGTEGGIYGGRISPDGKRVLFDRLEERFVSNLWVVSLDDGKSRQVTKAQNGFIRGYSWSPSGKRIAYTWVRFDPESPKDPRHEQDTESFLTVSDLGGKHPIVLLSERTGGISVVHFSFWDWR